MKDDFNDDKPYSNREIREFMSRIEGALVRIEIQTAKTNGRVTKLETDTYSLKGWRTGIGMCIAVFIIIVIPLAVYAYNQSQAATQSQIETNVLSSLSLQGQVTGLQVNKVSK